MSTVISKRINIFHLIVENVVYNTKKKKKKKVHISLFIDLLLISPVFPVLLSIL